MKMLTIWLHNTTGIPAELYDKLLISLIYLLGLWFVRLLILKGVWRQTDDSRTRYQWRKITYYISFVIAVLLLGRIWIEEFQSVATFLGLVSAGLAIAMKDPLVNVAGWVFIAWRRPFEVGDRIQIGPNAGDVIDIRVFQFTIMEIGNWVHADQSTGRIIHIPNGKVFIEPQTNYTKGWFDYIWNEVPVLVTFESNWQKAKEILHQIATEQSRPLIPLAESKLKQSSREFVVLSPKLESTVFTSVEASGILLTVRHLCEPRHKRDSNQQIWEAILERFAECNDIELAYPTQRFFTSSQDSVHK